MVSLTMGMYMKECSLSSDDIKKIYEQIGLNVKNIRMSKNISQLTLSQAIGHKAVGTVSMAELYLNNKHFNIEHLVKIANVLEVDVCEFFKDIDYKNVIFEEVEEAEVGRDTIKISGLKIVSKH